MNFSPIDYGIVAVYLVGVVVYGFISSRKQKTTKDYFLGGKEMKWWAVGLSIVASETSTLTFISIPGLAYRGNLQFMQLVFGYFVGRLLVTVIFIPAYYKGDIETAYDFLGKRFGQGLRKLTSSVFIITRVLASGVRLFATAIPVHIITGYDYPTSIAIIGLFTLIYTYLGGLKAVVTMDVVQMFIYVGGAITSMIIVFHYLPNGLDDVIKYATVNGTNKFEIFSVNPFTNFSEFFATPYTLVGALLGGTFLTMASHGTDQLLVQRLLGCKTKKESQKALMLDATVIVIQFAFFLFLGLCLYAFYHGIAFNELVMKSTGLKLGSSDEIFPKFIIENLPAGVAGLVVAGIAETGDSKKEMFWSRVFTLLWGVALTGGAMIFKDSKNPVVELGLSIASFTYGGLLGTFLLGVFFKKIRQVGAAIGFICGILGMVFVIYYTKTAYTWYTIIGVIITIAVANIVNLFNNKKIKTAEQI